MKGKKMVEIIIRSFCQCSISAKSAYNIINIIFQSIFKTQQKKNQNVPAVILRF